MIGNSGQSRAEGRGRGPKAGSPSAASLGTGPRLLLRGARVSSGRTVDVEVGDGVIEAVRPSDGGEDAGPDRSRPGATTVMDLRGYVLLPSPVEPHAHLDKALLLARSPNPDGSLAGAVAAMQSAYSSMSEDDIVSRASAALREAVAHGFTAIRTHADCGVGIGSRGVRALVRLREALRPVIQMQVVAMAREVTGLQGGQNLAILEESMECGADLVGGAPWREPDARSAMALLAGASRAAGCGMDLHVDETTQAGVFTIPALVQVASEAGLTGRVTASHCVSLASQPSHIAADAADLLAASGTSVIALPQSNLYLQGREDGALARPRGIAPIKRLMASGVTVAAGGDNWRDPFNPMGRIDALETASLLVTAAHLDAATAYWLVSGAARQALALPPVLVEPGYPADLMAVRARSLDEALAQASPERVVVKGGRITSQTTLRQHSPGPWEMIAEQSSEQP